MKRHSSPAALVPAHRATPTLSARFQLSVLGTAVAIALGLTSVDASAVTLGRLNVQSALGEPLRAEVDVADATPAEMFDLKVSIASAEAFRAAGVPYNAALSDVRVSLQRRADGRYVVRLTSNRLVSEPFVDLLLEATWGSGRIVRDYTVLLDPPTSRTASAAAALPPVAPQVGSAPAPRVAPSIAQAPVRRQRAEPAVVAPAPSSEAVTLRTSGGEQQIIVRAGDTASKIAGTYKPADVSLDQMLLALLRANPDAFIGGNVNRIKAGAVIDVPTAPQASTVPPADARRTVNAQSRDFNDYRRRLADAAPASRVPDADRSASGRLQANVEDRNAANASTDRLRITQGGAASQSDEQLARARQAQENGTRAAELSKNLNDLNKLQGSSGVPPVAGGAPATGVAPAPAAPVVAAGTSGTSTLPAMPSPSSGTGTPNAPAAAATTTATAGIPAAAVPPAAAASAAVAPVAPPAVGVAASAATPATPVAERSFIDELLANPIMLAGAALVALLIGFLLYRVLGRKRSDAGDSVFLESRMPKDSFFGASGGESVDTKNRSNSAVSSLSYSPSQLDAGDVDPVAEADVYLAYGRDLQAEEILREALRVNPERTAIHLKLLEIHAKRRDLRAYEALATEVHKLTDGTGSDWNRVVEMGKELDPGNPLYESGNRGVSAAEAAAFAGTLAAASATPAPAPMPVAAAPKMSPIAPSPIAAAPPPAFVPSVAPLDFDLDLSKPAALSAAPVSATLPRTQTQTQGAAQPAPEPYPSTVREPQAATKATVDQASSPSPITQFDMDNDFDTAPGALEPNTTRAALKSDEDKTQPATLRAGLPGDSGFIEFDMSSLTGLSGRSPADTERGRLEPLDESGESPHAIKLSLARELKALGDVEGARSLVEEVAAESSGDVKDEAKQLLAELH